MKVDLVICSDLTSAVKTLLEHTTRLLMLLHLLNVKATKHVRDALTPHVIQLPFALQHMLPSDQGKEMAQSTRFTVDNGVQAFFGNPYSPWQRDSYESSNGLLQQ